MPTGVWKYVSMKGAGEGYGLEGWGSDASGLTPFGIDHSWYVRSVSGDIRWSLCETPQLTLKRPHSQTARLDILLKYELELEYRIDLKPSWMIALC